MTSQLKIVRLNELIYNLARAISYSLNYKQKFRGLLAKYQFPQIGDFKFINDNKKEYKNMFYLVVLVDELNR